mgnify:FL=1
MRIALIILNIVLVGLYSYLLLNETKKIDKILHLACVILWTLSVAFNIFYFL